MKKHFVAALTALSLLLPQGAMAEVDPFPGVEKGQEVVGYRVSSNPGERSADFDARIAGTFNCPAGSASALEVNVSTKVISYYCVKTWESSAVTQAWEAYRNQVSAAQAAAEAESRAWNAANPGRQKCVQWGPFTDPNGGVSSGGVCANPVPAGTAPSGSDSISSSPVSEADLASSSSSSAVTSSSSPVANLPLDPVPGESVYRGSGYPYTQVLEGQVGIAGCPVGFQAANGLIADVALRKTFTECWPERAWTAYRLGGEAWELYKATGGSYDPSVEIDRRNKVLLLRAKAKQIAEAASQLTPGVERCSSWSGFGESGRECAYTFVTPNGQSVSSSVSQSVSTSSSGVGSQTNSNSATTGSSSISVALSSAVVEGSSTTVARASLLITPDSVEASSISQLAMSISSLSSIQKSSIQSLPKDRSLNYKVTSLTPKVCQASSLRVRINKSGVCKVGFSITDSVGNRYQIVKKLRRSF